MAESALAAAASVGLAGLIDAAVGEPPTAAHPVAGLGWLIGAFEARVPRGDARLELAWGGAVVAATLAAAGAVGWGVARGLRRLPFAARAPLTALALKPAFSVRGLVGAAAEVRDLLGTDVGAARESLKGLVSRDRELAPPQIASATVESLAENLTDSVTAPLLAYALGGLPGAYVYRAANTMDAMLGYRGEYEHVGKTAARLDDALNYGPARLTGALLCLIAATRGRGGAALAALRAAHGAADSPNKMWTIAPMAGLLGVQLEKPGHYRAGAPERPLTPQIIDEAIAVVWTAGAVALGAAAVLAASARRRRGR